MLARFRGNSRARPADPVAVVADASVDNALAKAESAAPPVGALVKNPGIPSPTPFLDVTGEEWDRIVL